MADHKDIRKKGFSGLSDLVSKIVVGDDPSHDPTSGRKPPPIPTTSMKQAIPREAPQKPPVVTVSSNQGLKSSGWKWIIGLIAAVGLIVWVVNTSERSTKKPGPYTATAPSQGYTHSPSHPAPAAPSPSAIPSSGVQYEQPPVGTNNVLSLRQICWCVRQDIRIEAMRNVADTEAGVAKFNNLVDDYNSRCGSFRYREGALENAKQMVEAQRGEIADEARSSIRPKDSPVSKRIPVSVTPPDGAAIPNLKSDRTVSSSEQIQNLTELTPKKLDRLTDELFYSRRRDIDRDASQLAEKELIDEWLKLRRSTELVDYIFYQMHPELNGRKLSPDELTLVNEWKSISRIVKSSISEKYTEVGTAPASLREPEERQKGVVETVVVPPSTTVLKPESPIIDSRKVLNVPLEVSIPANAHAGYLGNGWDCDRGFRRVGNQCIPVEVPVHGKLDYYGHDWECERGFRRVGNQCVPVEVPVHGKLDYYGHDWECERGFQRVGNDCVPVEVPVHGKLDYYGHDWECERGFQRVGNDCVPVKIPANAHLDYYGHDWECDPGYTRAGDICTR